MRIICGILIAAVFCVGSGNAWFPARVGRNAPTPSEHEKPSHFRRSSGYENLLNDPDRGGEYYEYPRSRARPLIPLLASSSGQKNHLRSNEQEQQPLSKSVPPWYPWYPRGRSSGYENLLNAPGGQYVPYPPLGPPAGIPWQHYNANIKPQSYFGEYSGQSGQSWPNHEDDFDYIREHGSRRPGFYPKFPEHQWPDFTTHQGLRGRKPFPSAARRGASRQSNFVVPDLPEGLMEVTEDGKEHDEALKEFVRGMGDFSVEKAIFFAHGRGNMENLHRRWVEYLKTKGVAFLKAHGNAVGKQIAANLEGL